ncbi:MAG TPA: hypothetical protein VH482_07155 [Thermomicrobiales bacterium]|jgi:hypothetical protein
MSLQTFAQEWCPQARESCRRSYGDTRLPAVTALAEKLVDECLAEMWTVAIDDIDVFIVEGFSLEDILGYHAFRVRLHATGFMARRMSLDNELLERCRDALRSVVCDIATSDNGLGCLEDLKEHVLGTCGLAVASYLHDLMQTYGSDRKTS